MNLTTCDALQQKYSDLQTIDPRSVYHALEQVKDGRKARGKRYPLALILTILLLGKLAGETTIHGIVEWVKWREQWVREQLGWPHRFPSNATNTRALAACDAEELVQLIAHVLLKAHRQQEPTAQDLQRPFLARGSGWQKHAWDARTSPEPSARRPCPLLV